MEMERNMKKKRKVLHVLLSFLILVICLAVYQSASIWLYADKDETRRADAAIVLGAAAYESGPSPVYRERLNQGIRLYREGYVSKIIVTGGIAEGNIRSDAAIGGEYLTGQGIPDTDIILEEHSTVTEENLKNAAEIMKREGYSSALVVSDPLHMKRAMLMAGDAGIEAYSSPTLTSRYLSMKTRVTFLAREVFYYTAYCIIRFFR